MKLEDYIKAYTNSTSANNAIHKEFTAATEATPFLLEHRLYIEKNKLGFGDRAFHYMWYLILNYLFQFNATPRMLEIGVYKGQVISLWRLLTKLAEQKSSISGITPLSGYVMPSKGLNYYFKLLTSSKFREDINAGNFYDTEDYYQIIRSVFDYFELPFDNMTIHKGLSSDETILNTMEKERFELIYIDGDHAREAVERDIKNFASKVVEGGFLVMDDASCNLPGGENQEYWKGHQSVSDACEIIPKFGFRNILNVGHNRIYQKLK